MADTQQEAPKRGKPCRVLRYCPYGPLVEFFPLGDLIPKQTKDCPWLAKMEKREDAEACGIFGHDCPVYYEAEGLIDE